MNEMDEWLSTRPEWVLALRREFPWGSRVQVEGDENAEMWWVVGYSEGDNLLISPVSPYDDYHGAVSSLVPVCASHYRASA